MCVAAAPEFRYTGSGRQVLASTLAVAARCERPTKICSGPCAARGTVRRHLLCTVGGSSCPRVASAYRRRSQKAATTAARSSSATREPLTPNAPMPTAMTRVGMTGEQTARHPLQNSALDAARVLARLAVWPVWPVLPGTEHDPQPSPSGPSGPPGPSGPSCSTCARPATEPVLPVLPV